MRKIFKTVRAGINHTFGYPRETGTDIRLDMEERLPLPRPLLDWFTGKVILDGQSRRNRLDPLAYLALDLAILSGATAGAVLVTAFAPALAAAIVLPPLWLIQTGRLRKMQTLEGHEAAHGNLFLDGDPRRADERRTMGLSLNDFYGELATAVALSHNIQDYKAAHDPHHAPASFTTLNDPDTAIVLRLRRYLAGIVDPLAYGADFLARLRSSLLTARPARKVMSVLMLTLLAGSAFMLPLGAWVAAIFLPWVVLFRLAGALQIMSLHDWRLTQSTDAQDYADRTWARFSGVALPARHLRGVTWAMAWGLWWAEILLVELPFRIGVLSPDLQAHDAHHLEWIMVHDLKVLPRFEDDWRNQPYRRAEMIRDSGDPLGMERREFWGVRAFIALARANLRRLN